MNPQWQQWLAEAEQKIQETYAKMEQSWTVPQRAEPTPMDKPMDKPMMEAQDARTQ